MKTLFVFLTLFSSFTFASDRVTPCTTEVIRTPTGIKSFEVQLLASNGKGYHTMKIFKNEGAKRTELPAVEIFYRAEGRVSTMVSVKTRETVMAYRERAASTREGFVVIQDGSETLELEMTCYL
jgi:hypothetical protein